MWQIRLAECYRLRYPTQDGVYNVSGETDLNTLLASMQPTLIPDEYVFASFANAQYGEYTQLSPIAMFMESEGMTLVIPKDKAEDHNIAFDSVFRCITLTVHSSLDAVGLTAAFANKLKDYNISANVIAGYYHDHIFVQQDKAQQAIAALATFQTPQ